MDEKPDRSKLGKTLTTVGYIWFALLIAARAVLPPLQAEALSVMFVPALITIFVGRTITKRAKQRSMEDVKESSTPVHKPRPTQVPRPRPQPPARRSTPRPRPEPAAVDPSKVEADLEKALAVFNAESGSEEPEVAVPIAIEPGSFTPKTSAEMIEEAHRRFSKDG